MKQDTQSQGSGTTQRDRMGREVGEGFKMEETLVYLCQFMLMYGKTITILSSNYYPIKINK